MSKQYFGTDGIRGQVGKFPITPDFMLKLGWAAGKVFARDGRCKILIGKDTRISGYMFESALEAGLSAAGVDVLLTGPMPTRLLLILRERFKRMRVLLYRLLIMPMGITGLSFSRRKARNCPMRSSMPLRRKWTL